MGVDVARVDEHHEVEEVVLDPKSHIGKLVTNDWCHLEGTACLRFVDPYGDTVFNQSQINMLLLELKGQSERDELLSDAKEHLHAVIDLVDRTIGKVHTYIKFIGD